MAHVHDQNLAEVIDLADVAVRTASQLRIAESGHGVRDRAALKQSLEFLERAKQGGAFMSKKTAQLSDTLRPLNWAADAYLSATSQSEPDYAKVEEYLINIENSIKDLYQDSATVDWQKVNMALLFFEALGEMLASVADRHLRRERSKRPFQL